MISNRFQSALLPRQSLISYPEILKILKKHLSQILNHTGEHRERYFNAVSPPVIQSSNFAFDSLESFRAAFADEFGAHLYTRGNNPTVEILRKKLAELERTEDALVFGSGSAAIAAAVLSQVQVGDHIVCVQNPYSWTATLMTSFLARFGVSHSFVDGTDTNAIREAIRPETRVLFLESPNTLTYNCQDLRACADICREHGLTSIIDNSYAGPIFQRPAEFGIDLICHSGTKYLNGHSDVVCGVVCGSEQQIRRIFSGEYQTLGAIISPHDAALVLRGLRTLELRMQRVHDSTGQIAERLEKHPGIRRVLWPLLPSFPQYELARRQMSGAGGLFSFELDTDDRTTAESFFDRLKRFALAVSWGGHESLIIPTVAFYGIPGRADSPLPVGFVRMYIGLEDPEWLWEDLVSALEGL